MAAELQETLKLTRSQAECLATLRNRGFTERRVAVAAKLDLKQTEAALRRLAELGLAERNDSKLWSATSSGETCAFEAVPEPQKRRGRPRRQDAQLMLDPPDDGRAAARLGSSARRLLDLLDRPRRGSELTRDLGLSRERVRQLLHNLHAQGRIAFGDPDRPYWLIRRADDETAFLSREEERVLSALPRGNPTGVRGLSVAAKLSNDAVEPIVENLVAAGLAEVSELPGSVQAFRITAAGLDHPQYFPLTRQAPPPRLPVQSDRVRTVLQTISDAGALRILEVKQLTKIQQQSINALMQYLKRLRLVAKTGDRFDAPYSLTEHGRAVLAQMTLRRAA